MIVGLTVVLLIVVLFLSFYLKLSGVYKVFYTISLVSILAAGWSFVGIGGFEALGFSVIAMFISLIGIIGMLVIIGKKKNKDFVR